MGFFCFGIWPSHQRDDTVTAVASKGWYGYGRSRCGRALHALECLYRCVQRGVEFLSELCPSSHWSVRCVECSKFCALPVTLLGNPAGPKHVAYCFVLWPTNAQLFHKLSHSYMFRHYRVILRELVISTLPSYTSISNDMFINCNWVVTRFQYTFTHKQYIEQHK